MRNDDVTVIVVAAETPADLPPDVPPPPAECEALRRRPSSARRQIEHAAAVSLAVGALGLGIALICGPKAVSASQSIRTDL